jgi:hypothetical protein
MASLFQLSFPSWNTIFPILHLVKRFELIAENIDKLPKANIAVCPLNEMQIFCWEISKISRGAPATLVARYPFSQAPWACENLGEPRRASKEEAQLVYQALLRSPRPRKERSTGSSASYLLQPPS